MKMPKTGTNSVGIQSAIKKAVTRADWYEQNYKGARDFLKRKKNQFWKAINRFLNKHELTDEQRNFMKGLIPEEYR